MNDAMLKDKIVEIAKAAFYTNDYPPINKIILAQENLIKWLREQKLFKDEQ